MVNPFKETVKDHRRFNAVAGADKFEADSATPELLQLLNSVFRLLTS
jgi:hypothetical protein